MKIGRVAVGKARRGRGVANAMLASAMNEHRSTRGNGLYLTAQIDKIALYERFGFVAFGDEFPDGGMPHLAMKNY